MMRAAIAAAAGCLAACGAGPVAVAPVPAPTPTPVASATDTALPPPADPLDAAALAGDFACGPFHTKDLAADDQPLLEDRFRVRFFPKGRREGGGAAGKIEVRRDAVGLFVGGRELFMRRDEAFELRAAKLATFGGDYDAKSLRGRDDAVQIVAGFIREVEPGSTSVALAHGWFPDAGGDVLDVAVFMDARAVDDVAQCRLFAAKILSTVALGPRRLAYGTGADAETTVSYATFQYRLSNDWLVGESFGIHDFARIHFRKRGVFPVEGAELQVALDSHPGDWASPGTDEKKVAGKLLGLPVEWTLTRVADKPERFGAWTISKPVVGRDHAVASMAAGSSADRDEALRLAESITRK